LPPIITDADLVMFQQANQDNPAAVLFADALNILYAAGCSHQTQGPGQHMASEDNPKTPYETFRSLRLDQLSQLERIGCGHTPRTNCPTCAALRTQLQGDLQSILSLLT